MPSPLPQDHPTLAKPEYPHGSENGYCRGCRCDQCRAAWSAARAEQRRQASPDPDSYGTMGRVDAGPAVRHLAALLEVGTLSEVRQASGVSRSTLAHVLGRSGASGLKMRRANSEALLATTPMDVIAAKAENYLEHGIDRVRAHVLRLVAFEEGTPAAVAKAAELAPTTVHSILEGSREHLHEHTTKAIMRLTQEDVYAAAGLVSPLRAQTRLGALQANGWSIQRLSAILGYADRLVIGQKWIRPALDERIRVLYEQIEDRPGGNKRVAEAAAVAGYRLPIYYDDDDMNLVPEWIPELASAVDDPQKKARNYLRIMGLTLREHTEGDIDQRLDLENSTGAVQTARRRVGLKLEVNPSYLTSSLIKPGQEILVALIEEYLRPIAVYEEIEALDEPGLDYVALWKALGKAAKDLRAWYAAPKLVETPVAVTEDISAGELAEAA